ncbi:VapA/VapB family virulence-associated protein [Xenorhabdus szentirmaii]|uniref:VapA/VapB family virulence-associated protein n=1 Tax=Xenorhabdus szentirmaii TaxID=290112 RepID=UPI0019B4E4EA|nr:MULTISPECIES: VapA/VapB family virulence-associated protein [unclassified Xenorhabdus]MBD2803956.1 VapA/VapB family virulence-associated protein [Xenorhabdus sp. ZM]MBD2825140.1 VapA/VapB family virulence-associated protein [Xenorhabdus sp. 5]
MTNLLSIDDKIKLVNQLVNSMDEKPDNNTINNIKEKVLNFGINNYSGTATIDSSVFYTTLELQLEIGKKFTGKSWGIESWNKTIFYGELLTNDIDTLTTEGNYFSMVDTAGGVGILFSSASFEPLGTFAGVGKLMIGLASGHGEWY